MIKCMTSAAELEAEVKRVGMLPYFRNSIPGFSVEENVPEDLLWDVGRGPWMWKGTVVRNWEAAYGKFFRRKAGYIALELLPHFINYRRTTLPLEVNPIEAGIYNVLVEHESLLSRDLKDLSGHTPKRENQQKLTPIERMIARQAPKGARDLGFDTRIARLQMAGRVVIADFEYKLDRHGESYGWGVARYTTPEALYGPGITDTGGCSPEDSFQILLATLRRAMPGAEIPKLAAMIR